MRCVRRSAPAGAPPYCTCLIVGCRRTRRCWRAAPQGLRLELLQQCSRGAPCSEVRPPRGGMGDYTVEGAQFLCSNPQAFADERRAEQEQWTRERDDFDHGLQNYSVDEAVFFRTNPQAKDIERKLREDSAAQRRTSAQVALLAQSGQLQLPEEYYDDGPRKIMAVVVEPKAPRLRPTDPAVADGGAADDLGFPVGSKVIRKRQFPDAPRGKIGMVVGHTVGGHVRVEFKSVFHGPEQWDFYPGMIESADFEDQAPEKAAG